jgi:hypothetical protein
MTNDKTVLIELVSSWLKIQERGFKAKSLYDDLTKIIPMVLPEHDEVIRACDNLSLVDAVHLADVRPIAELLGLELKKSKRDDSDYDIEYSFILDGVKFISIHKSEDGD